MSKTVPNLYAREYSDAIGCHIEGQPGRDEGTRRSGTERVKTDFILLLTYCSILWTFLG